MPRLCRLPLVGELPIHLANLVSYLTNRPLGLLEGGAPADEYGPEIGTIVPRVMNSQSIEEVTTVLHEEFLRWFGDDTAGPRHAYQAPASKVWKALLEFRNSA